ncbi:MAG: hypothetical protein WCW64_03640 [Phycisphaerae bacterium]
MRQRMGWNIAIIYAVCAFTFTSLAFAKDANEPNKPGKKLKGEVRFRYDWLGVNKNRARFREDNWMTDGSTGGLDWLHLESTEPDENGYEFLLEGKALYDYNYDLSFLVKKRDSHYLKLDFDGFRRYYDGSDEGHNWDSSLNLMVNDKDLFVDRRNYNIELGLTPPEGPQWVFGWHRLEKDGEMVLLRSARNGNVPAIRAKPDIVNMKGVTDTIYGEVSQTFAEKYNFRVRQEFEQYRDNQYGPLYNTGATGLTTANNGKDNLGYTNWRTMVMFDTFVDEKTYVTADYMFNYIANDSTHRFWQPASAPALRLDELSVDNTKTTNVYGVGYRRADFLQIQALDFSAGVRIEDSKTDSQSNYWTTTAPNYYKLKSNLNETRVAEVLRLVYKGFKRTTLSFDAQLEERQLELDVQRFPTSTSTNQRTDTDFLDQIYTFKAVHRFDRNIKATVMFRLKDLKRSDTELLDLNPGAYPGFLGDYHIKGNELLVKTDFRLNSKTSATLLYQLIQETIDFQLGGRTSNQTIHRGSGSISFNPTQNLFLVGTFMLENRTIDTPATPTTAGVPARAFDFRGKSYSLLMDATYAFNAKTSCTLGFQHTKAIGNADASGDYVFDKVGLTLKHQFAANKTIGLGYEFYNYNSHNGDNLDYRAHGAFATYTYTF